MDNEIDTQNLYNIEFDYTTDMSKKSVSPTHSYILFSLSTIFLVYFASYFQARDFTMGVLITQYLFILLPPFIFTKLLGLEIPFILRLNKVSIKNIILSICILLSSLPLLVIVNILFILLLNNVLGNISAEKIPVAQNISQLFLYTFLIGVSAGICEETLFRGFIMRGLEKLGTRKALILSSILFGILHFKIEKFPSTIILGLIIAYCVYRTNSLFTGIALHFTNNSLTVLLSYLFTLTGAAVPKNDSEFVQLPNLDSYFDSPEQKTAVLVFLSIIAISVFAVFLTSFSFLLRALIKNTSSNNFIRGPKFSKKDLFNLIWLMPGLILIFVISLSQVSRLLNISPEFLKTIIRFIAIPMS